MSDVIDFNRQHRRSARVRDVVRRFERCTLERSEWTHETHLLVGLWYVLHRPPGEDLAALRRGIKRYNEATGVPNTVRSGYHETITRFYVDALRMFVARNLRLDEDELYRAVLDDCIAARDFVARHYPAEVLSSPGARTGWVRPRPSVFRIAG